MTHRLQDIVIRSVKNAIRDLQVPEAVKEQIQYEVVPLLTPNRNRELSLQFMIAVGLPTRAGDTVIPLHPVEDPNDAEEIARLVRLLFGAAQAEVTRMDQEQASALNGYKTTPGGLVLPK